MYLSGINPFTALRKNPHLAKSLYWDSLKRVVFYNLTRRKLVPETYAGRIIHPIERANGMVSDALSSESPFLFGRYGTSEMKIAVAVLLAHEGLTKRLDVFSLRGEFNHCGLFPLTEETAYGFTELLMKSSACIDMFGTFQMILEDYFIKKYVPSSTPLTHLKLMNFYLLEKPFTRHFAGKTVLVIHPFRELIEHQYSKRALLYPHRDYLPDFNLLTIKAVQTIAGERDSRFSTWFEALDHMWTHLSSTSRWWVAGRMACHSRPIYGPLGKRRC